MQVDDLYLRGLIACFTRPTVPPEVLIASARLLAQIDHGSVDLTLDGDRAVLSYHGATLAELTEQVPGVSVRVAISLGVGSPAEMLITRAPIDPGLVALCRMGIEREGAPDGGSSWRYTLTELDAVPKPEPLELPSGLDLTRKIIGTRIIGPRDDGKTEIVMIYAGEPTRDIDDWAPKIKAT